MSNSVEDFKNFVRKHPKLRNEVKDKNRTWQSIYEDWVLLGEDDKSWEDFKDDDKDSGFSLGSFEGQEMLKTALNYVKKVKPEDITKTLSSIQKVIGLIQTFNGGGNNNKQQQLNYRPRRNVDPLFRRYDDYDD